VLPLLLPLALLSATQSPTTAPATCSVVVLDLDGEALAPAQQRLLPLISESLAQEVLEVSRCKVVSEADVKQLLELEVDRQRCGDQSDSCLAEIGAAMGAERVVSGRVGQLGEKFVVQARLLDSGRADVVARAEQVVPREEERLRLAARNVARQLFGEPPLPAPPVEPVAHAEVEAEETGPGLLLWSGLGLAGIGLALGVAGGVTAAIGEAQLADPAAEGKEEARGLGLVGLGAAGLGGLLAVVGGTLGAVALLQE